MKKRPAPRKSANGDSLLLPMTTADAAAAERKYKQRSGGKSKNRQRISSVCLFATCLTIGVSVLIVGIYYHYIGGSHHWKKDAIKAERFRPWKKYIDKAIKKHRTETKKKDKLSTSDTAAGAARKEKLTQEQVIHSMKEKAAALSSQKRRTGIFNNEEDLPLYKFESLRYPLRHSQLMLLYFAASWCPVSKRVTDQVDSLFRNMLLAPPANPEEDGGATTTTTKALSKEVSGLSLVYVSSDRSAQDFEDYLKDNWMAVPFGATQERDDIKRHFKTCSKVEMDRLGMTEREHEIPSLFVISAETHEVLTYDGVDDVADKGQKAVDYWMELLNQERQRRAGHGGVDSSDSKAALQSY